MNQKTIIKIKRLAHNQEMPLPQYQTLGSAGFDLLAAVEEAIILKPGEIKLIKTGISIELEDGFEAQIRPRSGLALKNGITVLNSPGTIDCDYRGEIMVILINHSQVDFEVKRAMKIAQMVITKYAKAEIIEVENLEISQRGQNGFGSTGI